MRRPLFNERLEGIRERSDFVGVSANAEHRALVLADGFYEWDHPEDRRQKGQPYRFTLNDGSLFAFEAVWATNKGIAAEPIGSCSIITCDPGPNVLLRKVHDRMPVMLNDPEQLRAWLSADVAQHDALSMCGSLAAERMSVESRHPGGENLKPSSGLSPV